jgi:hypothetical protein
MLFAIAIAIAIAFFFWFSISSFLHLAFSLYLHFGLVSANWFSFFFSFRLCLGPQTADP